MKKGIIASFFILITFLSRAQTNQPNIILIMADDMGYSDLGCYGSEIPTPHIDRLAANGVRFSQFYNTARCCPTRASLMTGLFQHQAGIGAMSEDPFKRPDQKSQWDWGTPGYKGYLNRNCVTIAEVLKPAGYHTYMTGKWHLGMHGEEKWPLQRGFDKYYGILAGASSYLKPEGGRGLTYMNTHLPAPQAPYYTTDAFTDSAIAFINQEKDNQPFFLYLAYNAPHWPLQAKAADIKKFEGKYLRGWDEIREARFKKQLALGIIDPATKLSPRAEEVRPWNELSAQEQKDVAYRMAVYAAQISCIDQNVGKLVSFLKARGKYDNTVIIFLSDNGACPEPYKELGGGPMEAINDPAESGAVSYGTGWANVSSTPYRKWKVQQEEGGIRAPFIISWPERQTEQNTIAGTPSYLIDVMPTILEVSGAQYPAVHDNHSIYPLEGRSFANALMGKKLAAHDYMFWEHMGNQAVRKGSWKAVKHQQSENWELYQILKDNTELHNVADQEPDILKDLVTHWQQWAKEKFVLPKRAKEK
ncbi:arylsulfatase [Niabella insulamsoli]|uniref:arylsulfatase n=1 Tax=Niabella insulamsoli TaxID=3144874 RepID=UPI0031FC9531